MNHEFFTWHSEIMVAVEMENLKHEIDNIRLIRDAGLSNPGWLERTFIAIGNILVEWGQRLRQNYTAPHQAYQVTSSKLAV